MVHDCKWGLVMSVLMSIVCVFVFAWQVDICYLAFLAEAQIALANVQMLPKESQCTYLHNAGMLKQ